MRIAPCAKMIGFIVTLFSVNMWAPLLIGLLYEEGLRYEFLTTFVVMGMSGGFLTLLFRRHKIELRTQEALFIVAIAWFLLGIFSALPLYFCNYLQLSFAQSVFETVSGLTTTGATVMTDLDGLPHSMLFYRQYLNFLGGLGIVVLAIAVFPMLGMGGVQLIRAELSSQIKESKVVPRIAKSAKTLWLLYLGLNLFCTIALWLGGMNVFDAVCYAFATVSTGGQAPHTLGIAVYDNLYLHAVLILFMILGATSFSLHYRVWRDGHIKAYFQDQEFMTFCGLLSLIAVFAFLCRLPHLDETHSLVSVGIETFFQVVSFATTTGFVSENYFSWMPSMPFLLLVLALIGGCTGSTAGGIKTIRALLLFRQGTRELANLTHPHGYFIVKYNQKPVAQPALNTIAGFIAIFLLTFVIAILIFCELGCDLITALGTVGMLISNTGTGFGLYANNFSLADNTLCWFGAILMILGRLELLTVLVLLTPQFWKK